MNIKSKAILPIVKSKDDLIAFLANGCKPREAWRIGTEHEKFAYHLSDFHPLRYDENNGTRQMLRGLQHCFGWKPLYEKNHVIALKKKDKGSITLEPGGQLELSGAPLVNIHQTCDELKAHLKQCKAVAAKLGIGLIGLGYNPKWASAHVSWMPKKRYEIMRHYMPKRGKNGLDMMLNTCTIQVNVDFDCEKTMVKMFRVSLALQPIATALFANSPFKEGQPSGYLSYRSHIWTDTDPDRCGFLPFVFEAGFGFERYVDYMLDVPMYFVYRNGTYINVAGQSFRDFLKGKLAALPGEFPTINDWNDHLTVAFPDVRLKTYLEMRGADGGSWSRICALSAFWVGLLYHPSALDAAWNLISDWTEEEHDMLRRNVPRLALKTPFRGHMVQDIARDVLAISHDGLQHRNCLNAMGLNETYFLKDLWQVVDSGLTPAEELLHAYHHFWNRNIDQIFTEYAY